MIFFVSQAQRIIIFTLDFNQMRIIAIIGFIRILIKGELVSLKHHKLDTIIIFYAITYVLAHLARDSGSAIFVLGQLVDLIIPYFVFRCLIKNYYDLIEAIKTLSILSVIIAIFFIIEQFTARNMFSIFGGVPEITGIRQGRLRCQGAFSHPIVAGVYFAVIMPFFVALWWNKNKDFAIYGTLSALIIVILTASSTPVFALLSGVLAAGFFYFRKKMNIVQLFICVSLILIHFSMKAPVWHLISRVSATGGSTSWFRFMLIDKTIQNFNNWWLIGSSSYTNWYVYGLVDLTNQFVQIAIKGGFFSLILFIYSIVIAFGAVGRAWRQARLDKGKIIMIWASGCSLFAMIMSFIGVALWGQLLMLWPMVLAITVCIDDDKGSKNIGI